MTDLELEESYHHNKGNLVRVEWIDAETTQGWDFVKSLEEWYEKEEPAVSYGLWINLGKNFIILAADANHKSDSHNRCIKIPRQWAVNLTVVSQLTSPQLLSSPSLSS
jgi:hypothetical protein